MGEHKRHVIKGSNTPVALHCNNNNHSIDWDNVNILDTEPIWSLRKISEMMHIHMEDNFINRIEDCNKLHNVFKPLLDKLKNTFE